MAVGTCRGIDSVTAYGALVQIHGVARQSCGGRTPTTWFLTPALAQPPVPIGTLDPDRPDAQGDFRDAGRFTPYTPGSNITGQPGIALPLTQRDDGLPIGVQLLGRPAGEAALLALGAQIEAARPWADRRAPVS